MMPQNSVDAFAFYLTIGIFSVVIGNLIFQSLLSHWVGRKCPAPCCEE